VAGDQDVRVVDSLRCSSPSPPGRLAAGKPAARSPRCPPTRPARPNWPKSCAATGNREPPALDSRHRLQPRPIPDPHRQRPPRHGQPAQPRHHHPAPDHSHQHHRRTAPPGPPTRSTTTNDHDLLTTLPVPWGASSTRTPATPGTVDCSETSSQPRVWPADTYGRTSRHDHVARGSPDSPAAAPRSDVQPIRLATRAATGLSGWVNARIDTKLSIPTRTEFPGRTASAPRRAYLSRTAGTRITLV
jgi:hypothetical protein